LDSFGFYFIIFLFLFNMLAQCELNVDWKRWHLATLKMAANFLPNPVQ